MYRVADGGDLIVTHWNKGEEVDLSGLYPELGAERRHVVPETALDVFRYADSHLAWSLSPNGQDVEAAKTLDLLLDLFLEDVEREPGDPRCF